MDISNIEMQELSNNVTKMRPSAVKAAMEKSMESPDLSSKLAASMENSQVESEALSSQDSLESNESQSRFQPIPEPVSPVNIPATQHDLAPQSSDDDDDDDAEETVESIAIPDSSHDEVEIPVTPETSQISTRRKRNFTINRQLELSLTTNSPLHKNPRTGKSPNSAAMKTRENALLETTGTSLRSTRTTPRAEASLDATPKSPNASAVAATTPKRTRVLEKTPSVATPKTPRFMEVLQSDTSTPNAERMTRSQTRAEVSRNTTLTRSASKKLNVDPENIAQKTEAAASSKAETKNQGKVKKPMIPVQTKASSLRTAKAVAAKQDSNDKAKETVRQPTRSTRANDAKQRPRWN